MVGITASRANPSPSFTLRLIVGAFPHLASCVVNVTVGRENRLRDRAVYVSGAVMKSARSGASEAFDKLFAANEGTGIDG
jgi:hypothetical protein